MLSRNRRREVLGPRSASAARALAETAVFTLAVPLVCFIFWPDDPLGKRTDWCYWVFAPILPALRYGFAYGFGSAVTLVGVIYLAGRSGAEWAGEANPHFSLGLVTLVMIAGEFASAWRGRWQRLQAALEYCQGRLDEFAPRYYALKSSHDRLERRLAGSTQSLRTALQKVHESFATTELQEGGFKIAADKILSLYGSTCSIRVASVFEVSEAGELQWPPVARLGTDREIQTDHPMLQEAIDLQETLSVGDSRAADRRSEDVDVLVAIPLVDSFQRIWGVVAVQDLPFVGLEEENLTLMAILGRALGDQLSVTMEATEADLDEARFRSHLRRSLKDLVDHDLPATVVVYRLDQASTTGGTVEFLMRQKRGLDVAWHDDNADGEPFVAILLPLNGPSGADGYLTRIAGMFRRRWGKSMDESGIRITTFDLSEADTVEAVVKEIRRSRRSVESEDAHLARAHA